MCTVGTALGIHLYYHKEEKEKEKKCCYDRYLTGRSSCQPAARTMPPVVTPTPHFPYHGTCCGLPQNEILLNHIFRLSSSLNSKLSPLLSPNIECGGLNHLRPMLNIGPNLLTFWCLYWRLGISGVWTSPLVIWILVTTHLLHSGSFVFVYCYFICLIS